MEASATNADQIDAAIAAAANDVGSRKRARAGQEVDEGGFDYTNNAFIEPELEQVRINADDVKKALFENYWVFINFFMAELLTLPIPPFHLDVFGKMVSLLVPKLALAIPRGHNKTTLAKLAVVYYFIFTDYKFIVYVSNTAEIAQAACRDIMAFMMCANFIAVFGHLEFTMNRPGEGFYIFKFTWTDWLGKIRTKTCILRALGAGQQVRGINVHNTRPELAVVDDLEDNDNTANDTVHAKLKSWVFGPFFKAMNKLKVNIIWLGNLLSKKSLLNTWLHNPRWTSYRYGAIKGDGTPLWPEMWSLKDLEEDYREYKNDNKEGVWFAEMMNIIIPPTSGVIKGEEIHYAPAMIPGEAKYGFITIDPAISSKRWAHRCGIAVHAFNELTLTWQNVDGYAKTGMTPDMIFNKTMEFVYTWGFRVIGIEQAAFQAALRFYFEHLLVERGETNVDLIPLPAYQRKSERISSWAAMLKEKRYALTEGHEMAQLAFDQLTLFNPAEKDNDDDYIDACAHGEYVILNHIGLVQSKYMEMARSHRAIETTYRVSAV